MYPLRDFVTCVDSCVNIRNKIYFLGQPNDSQSTRGITKRMVLMKNIIYINFKYIVKFYKHISDLNI